MTILFHSYLQRNNAGLYFSTLCNARQNDKTLFKTKAYKRKHLALIEIKQMPIDPDKIVYFDETGGVV